MKEIEKCFDFPIPNDIVYRISKKLIEGEWALDEEKWLKTETVQFYKGMYSVIRLINSVIDDEEKLDFFNHLGLDCIFMIHKLNEMSKCEG
jgi:hypothetical protein